MSYPRYLVAIALAIAAVQIGILGSMILTPRIRVARRP